MPGTPDENYWGNPPQTPRSKNIPQRPAAPQAPSEAYSAPAASRQPTNTTGSAQAVQQPNPAYGVPAEGQAPFGGQQAQPNAGNPSGQPFTGYAAPAAPPAPPSSVKKHTGLIVAITIVAALLVTMGGCVACTAVVSLADNDYDSSFGQFSTEQGPSASTPQSEQEYLNNETRTAFGLAGSAPLSDAELNAIQSDAFRNTAKTPDSEGNYAAGVYHVGTDIPAGGYWFTGSSTKLSYFYLLQPAAKGASTYNTVHVNNYYGHNLMNLEDGEVLILDNEGTMVPIQQLSETFSAPYGSGVYRVGVDVPEGTYQLIVGDGANDYSACYVMADLNFDEDSSYLYSDYFVKGDKPETITLEAGTYVELYNMQMKPTGLA